MKGHYEIVNWENYQHYKHRNPPWIKLYHDILSSSTWVMGTDTDRALMVASMLLAGRTGNKIPADPEYIKRVAYLNKTPDFKHLLATDFIRLVGDASNPLAGCKQDATQSREETEKSRDRVDRFDVFWKAYPKKVGKGAARKAWDKIHPSQDLLSTILSAISEQRMSEQWKKNKGQFIPNPATWLNQERWSDSVEIETVSAKREPYIPAEEVTPEERERRAANGLKGIQKVKEVLGR